ncbi:MAG: hypothetical protein HQK66_00295, partial [Desulfamplus sp.]|nr:hypothetical protein [Desulfamplus sp.]
MKERQVRKKKVLEIPSWSSGPGEIIFRERDCRQKNLGDRDCREKNL